jgi:hypothetical protein
VQIVPSRCPDCGVEGSYDREAALIVCPSCHLALQLTPQGARIVPYDHAVRGRTDVDAAFLPFWRFAFQAELPDRTLAASIEDYGNALFPQPPPGFRLQGQHLYVPAFRLLGTEPGDEAFKEICEWIHGQPPELREGKIPLAGQPRLVGVSLTSDDARALAPFVLVALHTKTSAARMSARLLKRAVQDVRMSLTEPRLLMVPFDREGDDATIPEGRVRIPAMLLQRGPELQHLRATVVRAAASEPR